MHPLPEIRAGKPPRSDLRGAMTERPRPRDTGRQNREEGVPPDKFALKVSVTPESMKELIAKFDLDVGDRPHVEPAAEGRGTLYAFAPEKQIREIEAAGYTVEVGENASEIGRQRMTEVSEGDRFEGGRVPPRGLGQKPGRTDEPQGREPEKGGQAR
jgi:hypothetical protein